MSYIDVHCHLNASEFDHDLNAVISRAKSSGVEAAIVVTETVNDFAKTLKLVEKYPEWIFPCLGVHPIQGDRSVTKADLDLAIPLMRLHADLIVGIGEIGLDFSPWICKTIEERQTQEYVFREQIRVAKLLNLPVNIHSRSAAKRAIEILIEEGVDKAVLHNFAGRPSIAKLAANHGYYMSFPPLVSTKPERNKLLKNLPLENICLETDSPSLGVDLKERNEPYRIEISANHISELKGLDISEFTKAVKLNTLSLFDKVQVAPCLF